jgi:hypothetical protein
VTLIRFGQDAPIAQGGNDPLHTSVERAWQTTLGHQPLLLDNVRYNYAQTVMEEARRQRILLDYLPPYSPNLNPIERLWKFVRQEFF